MKQNWRSSKSVQNLIASLTAPFDAAALAQMRGRYEGRTLFLLGNGPSLREMHLAPLIAEKHLFMTVNSGVRVLPSAHIPMHAVSDINRYVNHVKDIEGADVGLRFYRSRFRITDAYRDYHRPDQPTLFVPARKGGVLKRGVQLDATRGLGNDSTVLIFAAQLGFYMGFQTIGVMGCDLDYSAPNAYAYEMNDADRAHEASAIVQERRRAMVNANDEFAALRATFTAGGKRIVNCGAGGHLESLERVSFETLLETARRAD